MADTGGTNPLSKRFETETVISFNDGEEFATVYTRHRRIHNRMKRFGVDPLPPKLHYDSAYGVYRVPKKWIRINRGKVKVTND